MINNKNVKQPYATVPRVRQYLTAGDNEVTLDEELQKLTATVTDQIDKYTKRWFYPRQQSIQANVKPDCPNVLESKFDLLELMSIQDYHGASEIDLDDVWLSAGDNANLFPKSYVELSPLGAKDEFGFNITPRRAVSMTGLFSYAEDYGFSDGFIEHGYGGIEMESTASPGVWIPEIDETATTLTFTDVAPTTCATIRIQDELLFINSVGGSDTPNTYNVSRGINGSTAASFVGTEVLYEQWKICEDLEHWATRLTAWAFMQEQSPYNTIIMSPNFGSIEMPGDWPVDVISGLKRYRLRILDNL